MELDLEFEICIKNFRLKLGLTQKQLSIKAGLSQGYIAKLESANRTISPTLNTMRKISKTLKVCPYRLVVCNRDCSTCKLKF